MDLLEQLNPSQREAVIWTDGPALVLAGPGSGKTRVLTHRVAYLVREHGARPREIVAVTFTNKAAREMKERLQRLLGDDCKDLSVGTFHSICARILRREGTLLGYSPEYSIYDTDDQQSVVKRLLKEMNLDDKTNKPGAILNGISKAKNDLVSPDAFTGRSYKDEIVGRVYARYQQALKASNAMDFDDLLMNTTLVLQNHPDVLARYQRRYSYILVDEFQDTNAAQYILLKLLAEQHRNLFVVADEDQSIYSWRGADYRNIQRFREDYPQAPVILLERNYRSTQTILDIANAVISHNVHRTPKHLHTERGSGNPITIKRVSSEREEGEYVVREINHLVDKRIHLGDCAVMYRTNAQSRAVEEAFARAGQPYKLVGATRFYERREIKDALAYLRILSNPSDSVSLNRIINVPTRGIGTQTAALLFAWAGEQGVSAWEALRALRDANGPSGAGHPFSARAVKPMLKFLELWEGLIGESRRMDAVSVLRAVLEKTAYQSYIDDGTEEGRERWDNVQELINGAALYTGVENSLSEFLLGVSLVSDVDDLGEQPDTPVLLTLHMAKGLEFSVVFIVGLEEDILPNARSLADTEDSGDRRPWLQGGSRRVHENPEALEEERRLLYVGITRARDRLYLVHASQRTMYGKTIYPSRSRFLDNIPLSLTAAREESIKKTSPYAARASATGVPARPPSSPSFKTGDRVNHPKFGEGTVVKSEPIGDDEQVVVSFATQGVKTLLARFAKLEKVR